MFEWKEEYALGNGVIDEQHQRLFELGREVHGLLTRKRGGDNYDDLMILIRELKEYTVYHFDFEEGMMEAGGYPDLDLHEKEHRRFIAKLDELAEQDLEQFQSKVAFEMLAFVADWIEKHILNTDVKYRAYV